MTSTHFLRVPSAAYRAIALGHRRGLVLERAMGVLPGDYLVLREWEASLARGAGYSGAWMVRRVTDELAADAGLLPSHGVYSLSTAEDSERALTALRRKLGFAERHGISPERFWRDQERKEQSRREILRQSHERIARARAARREGARDSGGDERMAESE